MALLFLNGRVLVDGVLRTDLSVLVEGRQIAALLPEDSRPDARPDARIVDLAGDILAPGFIDTQVNGGGGVLFNDAPTAATIAAIGAAHRRFGTTGFLPTLISDDPPVIARAIAAVDQAIEEGVPGVLGIHIEGPFLNVARRGIHLASKIRPIDHASVDLVTLLRGGRTLVTLAPELATPELIAALVARGAVVAGGHSDARYDEARAAIAAGMTGATHLFNAMSPLGNREPGMVGAVLDSPGVIAGIVVDGRHVHPATLRIAIAARGADAFMLVTDAMPTVGGDSWFMLQGKRIEVRDGVCVDAAGTLAGSDLDMARAVRNAVQLIGVPPEVALAMASAVPARFLGLEASYGRIAPGMRASLVRLTAELEVVQSWIDGVA